MKIKGKIRKNQIPSLFTLINLFLGFLAVISVVEEYYFRAAYLIIGAAIFDALDGKLARFFRQSSKFGSELDSLADVVSFCLAPSVLIWSLYARDLHPVLGALLAGAPLYFGAIRLARFNVTQVPKSTRYFDGLPSPMNAFMVVALVLYYQENYGVLGAGRVVLPAVMASSLLMVSHVRYRKMPPITFRAGRVNSFLLILTVGTVFLIPFFGSRVMLPMMIVYLLTGLLRWLTRVDVVTAVQAVEDKT